MGHRVAVLVLPGVLPLEFGIAAQIFGTDPHYELTVCASGPVHGDGFCVTASAGLSALADAETVVVPGYRDIDAKPSGDVLAALRDAHQRGARLVSICSAAFALAAAGLLDGRPATTHWQVTDELRRQYPLIDVRPNCLYVDDGDILTSAGVTAGVDLCLHLIRRDNGTAAANRRARAWSRLRNAREGRPSTSNACSQMPRGTNSRRCGPGCSATSLSTSTSTRSRDRQECPGVRSSAASVRRPGLRRWPG